MTSLPSAPHLGNQWDDDRVLRSVVRRLLPGPALEAAEPSLREMGALAGGELYEMQLRDRQDEPRLVQWDAWGERVDRIEPTAHWDRAERLAAERGVVATAYEGGLGALSRVHQFALAYLFAPSTDMYACPLAMTDGAARTLLQSGNARIVERAVPRLTTRDPARFWTSGQWMTELTGGSDVGLTETVARRDADGAWRLYGVKWFTSAAASQMALTLARPEGGAAGGRGLALFYLETRDEAGRMQGIRVRRLKEKLGTRKLPTAELELDGVAAVPVRGLEDGVRAIAPMLNLTRTWNAVSAAAYMRRGLALARDYARRRVAFGATLLEQPLHLDTLAWLQAETEGATHLAFRVAQLIGRAEAGVASEEEARLLRMLTPVAKLTTARQAVAVVSECLEAFGGAGYVEDTGLPVLLRDAQVLPIWEGTTNVLSLDAVRALGASGFAPLRAEVERCAAAVREPTLVQAADAARRALQRAEAWMEAAEREGSAAVEAGARRLALTLGRSLELALLAHHAQWSLDVEAEARPAAATRRLALAGVDLLSPVSRDDARLLARDEGPPRKVAPAPPPG